MCDDKKQTAVQNGEEIVKKDGCGGKCSGACKKARWDFNAVASLITDKPIAPQNTQNLTPNG